MGSQQVPWLLVLTFSLCWGCQVKAVHESDTSRIFHNDDASFKKAITVAPYNPLVLSTHKILERAQHSSTSNHNTENRVPEIKLLHSAAAAAAGSEDENAKQRDRRKQEKHVRTLKLQKTREVLVSTADEASSLGQMLVTMVMAELRECSLVVAYDTAYSGHPVLQHLLLLHNPRQVVYVNTTEDLTRIIWTSSMCRGYFFLLDDPEPLLTFVRDNQDTWDYGGRHILVVPSLKYLEAFTDTLIGKKTEHIVGVVKSDTEGEWVLYMNQLYWGPGVRRINTWYQHSFTRQLDLFPDKLSDFHGAVLKVSTFHFEPCNFLHRAENGTVVLFYGTDVETVKAVARALNIGLEFVETPNGETWGEQYENGSWYGLMGHLERHEVDIGLANLFVSKHWLQVIDLTGPYRTERTGFLIRVEPPLPQWQSLSFPFNQWTWLAVLIGLIVTGPLLYLFARGSGQCGGEIRNLQDLSFAWYYAFGLHFCEAHKSLPRSASTQVFVQFLWLYTLVLTTSYTASLKSFLIMKKKPYMIQTIKELYESGLEVGGTTDLYKNELSVSANPYLKGLAGSFRYHDVLENIYIPMLQGTGVYLGNGISMDYLMKRFSRRGVSYLRIMKEYYRWYSVALGLQRHSPLKRKFDQVISWIREADLYKKFTLESLLLHASLQKAGGGGDDSATAQEDEAALSGENETEADRVVPLSLENMQGIFLITLFGWICGSLSFILERTIFLR